MLIRLYWAFFQIGLLSFGGGYAALPLIKSRIVDDAGWLSLGMFTNVLALSQMTPGPIAINAATFVGTRLGGFFGAIVATLGNVTPSIVMIIVLGFLYNRYGDLPFMRAILLVLRPIVVAMISSAALTILILAVSSRAGQLTPLSALLALVVVLGLVLMRRFHLSSIVMMLGFGALAALLYALGVTF